MWMHSLKLNKIFGKILLKMKVDKYDDILNDN